MSLGELLARRRMVRSFDGSEVDEEWLAACCAEALWAPTAGNSAGVRMATLGARFVGDYLDVATDRSWRESSRRYEGLRRAGGLVLVTARVGDYLQRYGESDKAASGLDDPERWPVPYWHGDAAMATMALLLLVEEAGLQAALWGNFRHADRILAWAGLDDEELFATVFVGRGDGEDPRSPSLERAVPTRRDRVRRLSPRTAVRPGR